MFFLLFLASAKWPCFWWPHVGSPALVDLVVMSWCYTFIPSIWDRLYVRREKSVVKRYTFQDGVFWGRFLLSTVFGMVGVESVLLTVFWLKSMEEFAVVKDFCHVRFLWWVVCLKVWLRGFSSFLLSRQSRMLPCGWLLKYPCDSAWFCDKETETNTHSNSIYIVTMFRQEGWGWEASMGQRGLVKVCDM